MVNGVFDSADARDILRADFDPAFSNKRVGRGV